MKRHFERNRSFYQAITVALCIIVGSPWATALTWTTGHITTNGDTNNFVAVTTGQFRELLWRMAPRKRFRRVYPDRSVERQ